MKDKSHKGQRHKGCGLCDQEKRAGNGAERRPARDRREIDPTAALLGAIAAPFGARYLVAWSVELRLRGIFLFVSAAGWRGSGRSPRQPRVR